MRKLFKLTVYIIVLAFLFTGCTSKDSNDIGDAIASVNGQKISMVDLDIRVEQVAAMYKYQQDGQEMDVDTLNYLKGQVLESLIDEKLLEQKAEKEKIEVTKEELENELKTIREQFDNDDAYKQFLEERKMTGEQLESYIKSQLLINKIFEMVTKDVADTSVKPEEYYENNKDEFREAEERQVRHILVNSEEDAKKAIARLDKGEDIAKLTAELSTDPDVKKTAGLVEYFKQDNIVLVREFVDAAFSLNEGEYTKTPVQTMFGFHVIKLEDIKEGKLYTFEEVKDLIIDHLLLEEKQNKFMEYTQGLRADAKIINNLEQILGSQQQTPSLPSTSGTATEEKPAETQSK